MFLNVPWIKHTTYTSTSASASQNSCVIDWPRIWSPLKMTQGLRRSSVRAELIYIFYNLLVVKFLRGKSILKVIQEDDTISYRCNKL